MNFIIMFMASPEYIRNPYLRAKMVEVLNCWMPRGRCFCNTPYLYTTYNKITGLTIYFLTLEVKNLSTNCHQLNLCCSGSSATATLFEGHQLSLEFLVKNLLKLYVDIEFTGSHTQVSCISSYIISICLCYEWV